MNVARHDASRVPGVVELVGVELEEVRQHLGQSQVDVVEVAIQGRLQPGHVAEIVAADPVVAGDVVLRP